MVWTSLALAPKKSVYFRVKVAVASCGPFDTPLRFQATATTASCSASGQSAAVNVKVGKKPAASCSPTSSGTLSSAPSSSPSNAPTDPLLCSSKPPLLAIDAYSCAVDSAGWCGTPSATGSYDSANECYNACKDDAAGLLYIVNPGPYKCECFNDSAALTTNASFAAAEAFVIGSPSNPPVVATCP